MRVAAVNSFARVLNPRGGAFILTDENKFEGLHPVLLGPMSRVFFNGPGDQGSIPGRIISKTQKMVLDAALLNTQYYKVIKSKMEQSRESSSALT